jgi:hypothetical protein
MNWHRKALHKNQRTIRPSRNITAPRTSSVFRLLPGQFPEKPGSALRFLGREPRSTPRERGHDSSDMRAQIPRLGRGADRDITATFGVSVIPDAPGLSSTAAACRA